MNTVFERPITYLITRGDANAGNFEVKSKQLIDTAAAAIDAGISLIQIREKALSARQLFDLTGRFADIARRSKTKILVNDRADIAAAAGADGVHLRSDSIRTSVVRRMFPRPFIIAVSTHSTEEAIAVAGDADLVVFGPVFETPGKSRSVGIAGLASVCSSLKDLPILALGGVDGTNLDTVLKTGAAGFASIRYLNEVVEEKAGTHNQ